MASPELTRDTNPEAILRRLGLDIHDGPLQELAALSNRLYDLRESVASDAELLRSANAIIACVGDVADQLRACVGEARGRERAERTLLKELGHTIDLYSDVFAVDLDIDLESCSLARPHCHALTRVVQTALANAAQHSGAGFVSVAIWCEHGTTVLEVLDDGRGFDVEDALRRAAEAGRLGLTSVLERIQALDGHVVIESAPGGPTLLRVVLPPA